MHRLYGQSPRTPPSRLKNYAINTPAHLGPQAAPYLFTTRHGGVSQGGYASLNLALHTGDDRQHVRANRALATGALGQQPQSWVSVKQVHGNTVVQVTAHASAHIEADALITTVPNVTLAVMVADCVPLVMTDASGKAVAAVHAGWRGTAGRIAADCVLQLCRIAACPPQELHIAVGPAIGPCCFVVGPDVAAALSAAYPTVQEAFTPQKQGYKKVDLWTLNARALADAGVPTNQVQISRQCTVCQSDYFSYRRDGALSGRQAGLITLPVRR